MRNIESKESLEKKKKRNNFIVSLLLIFIMLFSTLGYAFYSNMGGGGGTQTTKINYQGVSFIEQDGLWAAQIGNFNIAIKNDPRTVEKINENINTIKDYSGKPLYFYSENNAALQEVYINLYKVAQRTQEACLEGEKCNNPDAPIKTCDDNFIIIKNDSLKKITQTKNCVIIQGPEEELELLTDGFLLKIMGL